MALSNKWFNVAQRINYAMKKALASGTPKDAVTNIIKRLHPDIYLTPKSGMVSTSESKQKDYVINVVTIAAGTKKKALALFGLGKQAKAPTPKKIKKDGSPRKQLTREEKLAKEFNTKMSKLGMSEHDRYLMLREIPDVVMRDNSTIDPSSPFLKNDDMVNNFREALPKSKQAWDKYTAERQSRQLTQLRDYVTTRYKMDTFFQDKLQDIYDWINNHSDLWINEISEIENYLHDMGVAYRGEKFNDSIYDEALAKIDEIEQRGKAAESYNLNRPPTDEEYEEWLNSSMSNLIAQGEAMDAYYESDDVDASGAENEDPFHKIGREQAERDEERERKREERNAKKREAYKKSKEKEKEKERKFIESLQKDPNKDKDARSTFDIEAQQKEALKQQKLKGIEQIAKDDPEYAEKLKARVEKKYHKKENNRMQDKPVYGSKEHEKALKNKKQEPWWKDREDGHWTWDNSANRWYFSLDTKPVVSSFDDDFYDF